MKPVKFTINRTSAIEVLAQALKTCSVKAKGKVESEFIFKAEKGALRLFAMDDWAEQHLVVPTLSLEAEDGDMFSAYGPSVHEFLKAFGEGEVVCTFVADRGVLGMSSVDEKTKFAFPARAGEFVEMLFTQKGAPQTIEGAKLALALSYTAYAAHSNPAFSPLTGVKVSVDGKSLRAVASDENRVASYQVEMDEAEATKPFYFILPRAEAEILSGLLAGVGDVTVTPGESHYRFEWNGNLFQTALEPEKTSPYPDLDAYIQGEEVAHAVVSKDLFGAALKRAMLVAKDSTVRISIETEGSGTRVRLNTDERDRGKSKDEVEAQGGSGSAWQSVPCKQLQKAVETVGAEWLDLSLRRLQGAGLALVVHDASRTNQHLIFGKKASEEGE